MKVIVHKRRQSISNFLTSITHVPIKTSLTHVPITHVPLAEAKFPPDRQLRTPRDNYPEEQSLECFSLATESDPF